MAGNESREGGGHAPEWPLEGYGNRNWEAQNQEEEEGREDWKFRRTGRDGWTMNIHHQKIGRTVILLILGAVAVIETD